jgi:Uma2 family endonuclease
MATAETRLITAEEFWQMPDLGSCELVHGEIVTMNPPGYRHGLVCFNIAFEVGLYVRPKDLGTIVTNDSGIITERRPDSVRGGDVAFYHYDQLPRGQTPKGYPNVVPEVVWEVLSPDDRWKLTMAKIAEYLNAGVRVVCIVDPDERTMTNYFPDKPPHTVGDDQTWSLPDVFPGLEIPARKILP